MEATLKPSQDILQSQNPVMAMVTATVEAVTVEAAAAAEVASSAQRPVSNLGATLRE